MPLWTIYHSDDAFQSSKDRDEFAKTITESYGFLPAFYVVVSFVPLKDSYLYRSGERVSSLQQPFVRLVIHHLARHAKDSPQGTEAGYTAARGVVDRAIKQHIIDKGYLWEYTVSEDSRDLWKIDNEIPPPFGSETMLQWKKDDRVSPY